MNNGLSILNYNSNKSFHLPLGWTSNEEQKTTNKNNDTTTTNSTNNNNIFVEKKEENIRMNCSIEGLEKKLISSELLVNTFTKLLYNLDSSWSFYDPKIEFKRQNIPDDIWRLTEINKNYEICDTYPSILAVPVLVDDELVIGAAQFRSKNRFPALCWRSAQNFCTICRSSQPLVGLANNRNFDDEILIHYIQQSTSQMQHRKRRSNAAIESAPNAPTTSFIEMLKRNEEKKNLIASNAAASKFIITDKYVVVDARPLMNARANQATGKGVESEKNYDNVSIIFMDIANIHSVRKSLDFLTEACVDETSFLRNVDSSGWLSHIRKIMLAASRIVHLNVHEYFSVLVHCSDGWDRTAQLTSLSMLFLDKYYRTLEGFIVLIEKEWISFGHKFADRCGWINPDGWKDEERSPIFLQFLDCVHQCLFQMCDAFEFNEELLLFLAEHLHTGWFGTFLCNSEKELKAISNQGSIISIWTYVLGNRTYFTNKTFQQCESPVVPVVTLQRLVIWSKWFLRWNDRLWNIAWSESNHGNQEIKKNEVTFSGNWADDKIAIVCLHCEMKFTFFKRKHHCRCCGQVLFAFFYFMFFIDFS
jgi:myotubularin-related protein 1/2